MDYRVSVLQYEPKLLDKQKNLAMLREMLCELDTDLVACGTFAQQDTSSQSGSIGQSQ